MDSTLSTKITHVQLTTEIDGVEYVIEIPGDFEFKIEREVEFDHTSAWILHRSPVVNERHTLTGGGTIKEGLKIYAGRRAVTRAFGRHKR